MDRWIWLCPALMILVAAGLLTVFGLTWWAALLAALLLACPVLLAWGAIQVRRRRRGTGGPRPRGG